MNLQIILDFDGVLFDSAKEVYQICEKITKGNKNYIQNLSYKEFLKYRSYVTDAWQYSLVYSKKFLEEPRSFKNILPDDENNLFAKNFFLARSEVSPNEIIDSIKPYNFFNKLSYYLNKYPNFFSILSTRNINSIDQILNKHKIHNIKIYGQEDVKKFGSKICIYEENIKSDDENFTVFIDDIYEHLIPFKDKVDLTIHAGWGYGHNDKNSLDECYCFKVISSIFKIYLSLQK